MIPFHTIAILPEPHVLMVFPFALLLLSIAVAPLVLRHHWERHYHKLCAGLAGVTCAYYLVQLRDGPRVMHAALDYLSFIIIVAAFYIVTGGIHVRTRSHGTPGKNTVFLLLGSLLANVIGTVGASMLLIRPWIALNRHRFSHVHAAFFIFAISNVGGALLPIGPPLLLGYLKGVPFWWPLQRCSPEWMVTLALILLVFFCWDFVQSRSASPATGPVATTLDKWQLDEAGSFVYLAIVLLALIFLPGGWREFVMTLATVLAYFRTPARVHAANEFTFAPLREVAWLFLGIFGTMIPVLDLMKTHATKLGLQTDLQFYWASGLLSALLDNAPTYLTFVAGALGLYQLDVNQSADVLAFVRAHDHYLVAISLGATCFGALTYIGNGPNLLVKAITEHAGVSTPSFFGYFFRYAAPVLLPIFVLISILFFRN